MLELNRLIQRIRCDITSVKKQVGSDLVKLQPCDGDTGLLLRKKRVSLPGLGVPGTIVGLLLTLHRHGEDSVHLWLTHCAD